MKLRTFSLLSFCFCIAVSAFAQTKVLQAGTSYSFDIGSGSIVYGDSIVFSYFPVPKMVETSQDWNWSVDNQAWEQASRWIDHQFDSNGNLTLYVIQTGNDQSGWNNSSRTTVVYDTDNRLVSWVVENWSGGSWNTFYTYKATYDQNGNVITEDGGAYLIKYFYDAQGVLTERIVYFDYSGGVWTPDTKLIYTYENNGQTEYATEYTLVDTVWTESQKVTSTYDGAGNLTQLLIEDWKINNWENSSHYDYYYNASNNLTGDLWQYWVNGAWQDISRTNYTYDSDNDLTDILYEGLTNGEWQKSGTRKNYYTEYVPTTEPAGPAFQMFPNPASSQLILKGSGIDRVTIYSQDGKPLRTQALQGKEMQVVPLNLPDGQYQVQVKDAKGGVSTKTLQVIH